MSEQTPNLSMPYIQAAQAQKHVTHNEAIELLDTIVQLTLEATDGTIPPANAAEGQAWGIGSGATGVWASHDGEIAAWRNGGWLFAQPKTGWRAYDKSTQMLYVYGATGWIVPPVTVPDLNNLDGVGINASADLTNRLVVSADATLLNHDGAGHQVKVNKSGPSDTASLLFQTNWSGRAEMGLSGSDDFSVKVSQDGGSFLEALRIDSSSGHVTMPATGQRQLLPFSYRYSLYADKPWIGHSPNNASALAAANLGTGAEPNLIADSKGIFLPAGTEVRAFHLAGNTNTNEAIYIDFRASFLYGAWGGSADPAYLPTRDDLQSSAALDFTGESMQKFTFSLSYVTPQDGYFICAVRPAATSSFVGTRYLQIAGGLDVLLVPTP